MNADIYCRRSTDKQDASLGDQEKAGLDYCKKQG
jgi:DNA invertase Pin-like site-specific DNA recombinase